MVAALGLPAKERSVERSWKIPEQYVIEFATPLNVATPPEAVFQVMLCVQQVGSGWSVLGPHGYDDGSWEFEMVCAVNASGRFRVPGVAWAHVSLEIRREAEA